MNEAEENNKSNGYEYELSNGFKHLPDQIIVAYSQGRAYKTGRPLGVRIWRPSELGKLINAIPKKYSRTQFEFLLYTGMRYVEAQALKDRPDLFDGRTIHLTPDVIAQKKKCKFASRYVILSPIGRRVVSDYLDLKKALPNHTTWQENLGRWSVKAKIDPSYVSCKSTRKTWESFLIFTYPMWRDKIFTSQGHTELTALRNYVNLPFTQKDKDDMIAYVAGWSQ